MRNGGVCFAEVRCRRHASELFLEEKPKLFETFTWNKTVGKKRVSGIENYCSRMNNENRLLEKIKETNDACGIFTRLF